MGSAQSAPDAKMIAEVFAKMDAAQKTDEIQRQLASVCYELKDARSQGLVMAVALVAAAARDEH